LLGWFLALARWLTFRHSRGFPLFFLRFTAGILA
jgi:hypothetical protein